MSFTFFALGKLIAAYPFRAKCAGPMLSNNYPNLMTTTASVSGHGVIAEDTLLAVASTLTFASGSRVTVTLPDERWGGGAMYASAGELSGWGSNPIVACTGGASFKDCQSNCGTGDSTVTWMAPTGAAPSTVTLMFLGNRGSSSGNARSGSLYKHTITLILAPTAQPTAAPTTSPTAAPSAQTAAPTASPSAPTDAPPATPTDPPTMRAPSTNAAAQEVGNEGDTATANRTAVIVLGVLGGISAAALFAVIVVLAIVGASVSSQRRHRKPMAGTDGNSEASSPRGASPSRRGAQRGVVEMSPAGFGDIEHNSSSPNFFPNPMGRQSQQAQSQPAQSQSQPAQSQSQLAQAQAPAAAKAPAEADAETQATRGRSTGASCRGSMPGTLGGSTAGVVPDVMFVSERRLADGLLCTRREFVAHYGGTSEWDAAGEHRRSVTGWYSRAQFVAFYGGTAQWDNAAGVASRSGI